MITDTLMPHAQGPIRAQAPPKPDEKPEPNLREIVRPEVRDRFTGLVLRGMTPKRVQAILDGAFAGILSAQFELFDLMEDTWPRLKKNLNEIKRAIIQADWHAEASSRPEQKPSALATAKQEFLAEVIDGFLPVVEDDENGFEQMLYDLTDAVGKGVSVQEIYWEIRDSFGSTGKPAVVPRATRWIPSRYFGYRALETSLQLSPSGRGDDMQPFPPDKFIVSFFKTKTGHPVGTALLRSLATMWIGSSFSYDWALNLAQIFGLPFRWVEYDPTQKGILKQICAMLENMGSAGWGAFPAGTKLELHEAVRNAGESPQAYLMKLADTACDILLLGQTLTSNEGKSGSRALGQVHYDVRQDVIKFIGHWAATALNYSLVPALMRLNFGNNDDDPYLVCDLVEIKDAQSMAERDAVLMATLDMPVPKKWLYERHDIPMPGPGDEIFKVPTPTPAPKPNTQDPATDARAAVLRGAAVARRWLRANPGAIQAKATATDKLVDNVLEDLTGVEAKWLGGVKPFFAALVDMAQSEHVTDADFVRTVEQAARMMPELFERLDAGALEDAMFSAMAPALINGVSEGVMHRRAAARKKGGNP